jgi:hypothetical protein
MREAFHAEWHWCATSGAQRLQAAEDELAEEEKAIGRVHLMYATNESPFVIQVRKALE